MDETKQPIPARICRKSVTNLDSHRMSLVFPFSEREMRIQVSVDGVFGSNYPVQSKDEEWNGE